MIKFQAIQKKIRLPKINFQRELKEIADNIIIPVMKIGIDMGIDIDDKAFSPNELKTVKRKGSSKVLFDKGKLYDSFKSAKSGKYNVKINLKAVRSKIGEYLQISGIKSNNGLKKYKFFGITKQAEKLAMEFMEKRIGEAIKNA